MMDGVLGIVRKIGKSGANPARPRHCDCVGLTKTATAPASRGGKAVSLVKHESGDRPRTPACFGFEGRTDERTDHSACIFLVLPFWYPSADRQFVFQPKYGRNLQEPPSCGWKVDHNVGCRMYGKAVQIRHCPATVSDR